MAQLNKSDISKSTKRRRFLLDKETLDFFSNTHINSQSQLQPSTSQNINDDFPRDLPKEILKLPKDGIYDSIFSNNMSSNTQFSQIPYNYFPINHSIDDEYSDTENISLSTNSDDDDGLDDHNYNYSTTGVINNLDGKNEVLKILAQWAIAQNITLTAFSALLKLLKNHSCFSDIPVDARTVLKINNVHQGNAIQVVSPGLYYHFGVANGLINTLVVITMDKFLNSSRKRDNPEVISNIEEKQKIRKYDDSYLNFGFTSTVVANIEHPQCVVCLKVMAVESMLPNKMKRHLETVHGNLVNKPRDYFVSKLKAMAQQKHIFTKQATIPSKALLSSYKVAWRIAKSKKPHTIAKNLILPAAMDMVSIMIGDAAAKQLQNVPLSDNTISRRIQDMAEDINDQLIEKLIGNDFAIQLDEATDSHNDAHLICYVRFVVNDVFHEDLLFCKTIVGETKAADLFNILDSFIIENNIVWDRCFGVCTDGARSMAGCYNGLQALVKKKAPNAVWTHCIIHREALASKIISPSLNEVLLSVIEIVNFIKTRPIKSRCFKKMCEDMGAEHTSLLYYCNSRWLSRGNVLKRLTEKITSFKRKLVLWKNKMDEGALNDCFPTLYMFLHENNLNLIESIKLVFMEHLSQLIVHFQNYFPEDDQQRNWIKDPFTTDLPSELTITEQEQLIDLYSDSVSKSKFVSLSLPEFWIAMKKQYPIVANKAIRTLIPFASSYLCETGFSALAVIKSKYRGKLNTEKEMRIALSKFTPRFDDLMQQKQAQPSH
ncbi:protein FAM200A-like [Metopolophium dirhodum]|uniref:protein FAM200A-like n=3 Tax=Aphidinae TaxID=133076 RepID=UPI00298FB935|nr:protein FAM200A-like [Metopolophium dirhodum]